MARVNRCAWLSTSAKAFGALTLQRAVRIGGGAPDMRDGRAVESEALLRLPEMPADDVDEIVYRDFDSRLERVKVVHGDEPRLTVPAMLAHPLVLFLLMRRHDVVGAEHRPVELGV